MRRFVSALVILFVFVSCLAEPIRERRQSRPPKATKKPDEKPKKGITFSPVNNIIVDRESLCGKTNGELESLVTKLTEKVDGLTQRMQNLERSMVFQSESNVPQYNPDGERFFPETRQAIPFLPGRNVVEEREGRRRVNFTAVPRHNINKGITGTSSDDKFLEGPSKRGLLKALKPKDCGEILACSPGNPGTPSGIYRITPDDQDDGFDVYCDMETDGGGWTVFQRRLDGSEDFSRKWDDYKNGFGNMTGEFWLGLEKLYRITLPIWYQMRVDLQDAMAEKVFTMYTAMSVSHGRTGYALSIGDWSGRGGDGMGRSRSMKFTTTDRDNDKLKDKNCADLAKGGFWYNDCGDANPNGVYYLGEYESDFDDGIYWNGWHGPTYSLKSIEMKIRARSFGLDGYTCYESWDSDLKK
ncbi:microfibril-associated glycoprotein 4-like [Branchiostoma floridae x Branchiostoma japonicum]